MTDERLMEMLLDGEGQALDKLVLRYQGPLYGFAFRILGDQGRAEDAFQETFLKVYRRRYTYQRGTRFKPWLYQICLNVCRDTLRKKKRRPEIPLEAEKLDGPDDAPGPEEAAHRAAEAEAVREALAELPVKQREVILLSHYQNLSYPEISEILDIPTGTVKSRVFHALRRLAKLLGRNKEE